MPLVDNAWYVSGAQGVTATDQGIASSSVGVGVALSITVPAGALVVVIATEATATTIGTVSDATNGAYTAASSVAYTTGVTGIFYFANSASLSSVILTYTKNISGGTAAINVFYLTGMATSSPLDSAVTATTTTTSATPTLTSGTPSQQNDVIIGLIGINNGSTLTYTQASSFPFFAPPSTSTNQATAQFGGGMLINQGTTAVTYAPTLSGAPTHAGLITVGFKAATVSTVGYYGVTAWSAAATKVCGNLIRQNTQPLVTGERVFVCIASTSGTGTTGGTEPTWVVTRGAKNTDNTVTWQEATGIAALNGDLTNTPNWTTVKGTAIVLGQVIQNGAGTLILICTTAGTAGSGSEPSWSAFTNAGATTADNTVTWTTLGASFSNWSAPHARLGNAVASNWGQAGNSFFVTDNHAEMQLTAYSITVPGNFSLSFTLSNVYCVNHSGAVPPGNADLMTTASISTNGSFTNFSIGGTSYTYGIIFNSTGVLTSGSVNGATTKFENCAFQSINTSSANINVGVSNTPIYWVNCTVQFAQASSFINVNSTLVWENTASAITGTVFPSSLLFLGSSGTALLRGVDLSALGSGKTLVTAGTNRSSAIFQDCKLGSGVSIQSPSGQPQSCDLIRADSGATNYRQERYQYAGTLTAETVIVRTNGATDGVTPISWKIVTTANSKWLYPFLAFPISIWNTVVGLTVNVTIYGIWGGGAVPNNDDIWIEVEYLGSSATPMGSFINDTKASNLATGTALSSDSSAWGGSVTPFKMSVVITPQMVGPINVIVKAAKVSSTFYIDPLIVLS